MRIRRLNSINQKLPIWLVGATAALLTACGGGDGEQPKALDARLVTDTWSSPDDEQGQTSVESQAEETAVEEDARLSPAELLGGRPNRPSELIQPDSTGTPPPRPARTPQSTAMASLCQAQTWNWGEEGTECQGMAPATQAGGGQFIIIENRLAATMGVKWMRCVYNSDGKPTWLPHVLNGYPNESCTVREVVVPSTEPLDILQRNNCLACHTVDGAAILGPSFRQIADHYRDSPPPPGELESRIRLGGAGTFGSIPMPSQPQISNDAIAIVVPWILSR